MKATRLRPRKGRPASTRAPCGRRSGAGAGRGGCWTPDGKRARTGGVRAHRAGLSARRGDAARAKTTDRGRSRKHLILWGDGGVSAAVSAQGAGRRHACGATPSTIGRRGRSGFVSGRKPLKRKRGGQAVGLISKIPKLERPLPKARGRVGWWDPVKGRQLAIASVRWRRWCHDRPNAASKRAPRPVWLRGQAREDHVRRSTKKGRPSRGGAPADVGRPIEKRARTGGARPESWIERPPWRRAPK